MLPVLAHAQSAPNPTATDTMPLARSAGLPGSSTWSQVSQPQSTVSKGLGATAKGAIMGAGGGAAVGSLFNAALCDGARCGGYVAAAFLFGGIGAAIGTFVGWGIDAKKATPGAPSITVGPIISRDARGGAIAVRF